MNISFDGVGSVGQGQWGRTVGLVVSFAAGLGSVEWATPDRYQELAMGWVGGLFSVISVFALGGRLVGGPLPWGRLPPLILLSLIPAALSASEQWPLVVLGLLGALLVFFVQPLALFRPLPDAIKRGLELLGGYFLRTAALVLLMGMAAAGVGAVCLFLTWLVVDEQHPAFAGMVFLIQGFGIVLMSVVQISVVRDLDPESRRHPIDAATVAAFD